MTIEQVSREMRAHGYNHTDSLRWGKCTGRGIIFATAAPDGDGGYSIRWPK